VSMDMPTCYLPAIKFSTSSTLARRITEALAEAFPDDPCLGDFALFGSGVSGVL
jgi:hypothetical protein